MLLRTIGCWSPYPRAGEACSGYLVTSDNSNILLDCGHGVSAQLSRWLPSEQLTAVIISHFHPDHYADMFAVRHMIRAALYLGKRQHPLPVYMPAEPAHLYAEFAAMQELQVHTLTANSSFAVGDILISPFTVQHSLPAFGIRVENQNRSLVYTADTSFSQSLVDEVKKGTDLLLCECTLPAAEGDLAQQVGHMTTADAGRLAREGGAAVLLATHFWPEYDLSVLQREIEQEYQGQLIMAAHDLAVTI